MRKFPELPRNESLTVEFKSLWDKKKIAKTLVAFANTVGGDLYIGVDDAGNPIGVNDTDAILQSLASLLHDAIFPSMIDCVSTEILTIADFKIVKVHVTSGRLRPYCLDPRRAGTVYVRVENTTSPATLDDLREIIRENNTTPFESRPSEEQNLTFSGLNGASEESGFNLDPKKNCQYGLWDAKGQFFTNLALILSDQSTYAAVMVLFADDEKLNIKNGKRIEGSIFALIKGMLSFIAETNTASWELPRDGTLMRKENYYVAPLVLREAVVNAVAHRDYERKVPITVHITPSSVEIYTAGGLADLDAEEVMLGMATNCRNPKLASLLGKLRLMEGVGNGFRQFRNAYEGIPFDELLSIGKRHFTIRLPRAVRLPVEPQGKAILQFIAERGRASRAEIQEAFAMSSSAAVKHLQALRLQGSVLTEGRGPAIRYRVKKIN